MKEILVNESQNQPELVLQVFWGLLACEILNGKDRDVVEHTSLKKMRELIERKFGADRIGPLASKEHTETISWLLHWLLVYSFTADDLTTNGLFASLVCNHNLYGQHFLNIVQMRAAHLAKYMITSMLLSIKQPHEKFQIHHNALETHALPIALDEINSGSDCAFAAFLKAVYEDYDLDEAITLVDKMTEQANEDVLLRRYALDIKQDAYILIFQMKARLYRVVPVDEIKKCTGDQFEMVISEVDKYLQDEGFVVYKDATKISCNVKPKMTTEESITQKAQEMFGKTEQLKNQFLI